MIDNLGDRYRILRELGRGAMATVYLAEDVRHRREVAVKVLLPEVAAEIGKERFLREIEIAAALGHPHILPLHDSGEDGGLLYYVMPFAEGESLQDRLAREKQLPIDEALRLGREVADALAYAHSRGVVHRDIKRGDEAALDYLETALSDPALYVPLLPAEMGPELLESPRARDLMASLHTPRMP